MDEFTKTAIIRIFVGVVWLLHGICVAFEGSLFNIVGIVLLVVICFTDMGFLIKHDNKERIKDCDFRKATAEAFYQLRVLIIIALVIVAVSALIFDMREINVNVDIVISSALGIMEVLTGIELFKLERRLRIDSDLRISNYEAIVRMNIDEMKCCLDDIYVAGLNEGMYAANQDEETMLEIIGDFPFNKMWLEEKAESAVFHRFDSDEEDLKIVDV